MKKNYGKNEASHIRKNNTVIMIVSVLAVTLFIGAVMQPVIAGSISTINSIPVKVEEECLLCKAAEATIKDPSCKTCGCAVNHAVVYMVDFVNETMKDYKFPLWRAELVGMIFEGLIKGFIDSGFKLNLNAVILKAHIKYWVDKLIEPENYRYKITEILANIGAIGIGITGYLLTLCKNNVAQSLPAATHQTPFALKVISEFYKWIKIFN